MPCSKNDNIFLNYSQRELVDIFSKRYLFGIELNPEYQRDYVWELSDKVALIDSIFNHIDIGKFVFAKLEWDDRPDHYSYEIIDGKQRINTICEYYENKFAYNGLFYNDLSVREQDYFEGYMISVAEISRLTREEKLKYFIMVNTTGKVMDKKYIEKAKRILDEMKELL
jgi:hypothetical protein